MNPRVSVRHAGTFRLEVLHVLAHWKSPLHFAVIEELFSVLEILILVINGCRQDSMSFTLFTTLFISPQLNQGTEVMVTRNDS